MLQINQGLFKGSGLITRLLSTGIGAVVSYGLTQRA